MATKAMKGLTIEIDGNTTKLGQAIKEPVEKSKELRTSLKNVEAALKLNPGNMDLIRQKQVLLTQAVDATADELKALKDAQQRYIDSGQNLSASGYTELEKQIGIVEGSLKNLKEEQEKYNSTLDKVSESARKFGEGAEKAGQKLMPVSAGVAGLGTIAVKTTADFDSSMSQVQAVSGATAEEMEELRTKAREMGATTKFSASEAADAMNYMGMAGWKSGQMIEGIDGIMNLAAASGEDLATTSDIVTDALTAFGMEAERSGELADVLAAASSNANTNVSMMGESFKYVASVAGSMGYTAQDTSIALGLMANSGIKASQAGTSLRSIMSRMAAPTKEVDEAMDALGLSIQDDEGNMKSFRQIMGDLRAAFANSGMDMETYQKKLDELNKIYSNGAMKEEDYVEACSALAEEAFTASGALNAQYASAIAGKNGMSGLLAIVGASEDDYNKLCNAVDHASDAVEYQGVVYEGTAAKMAAVMNDNLEGQITLLKSALEELAISFGDILMPIVRDVVAKIQDIVDWLNNLDEGTKKTIIQIGAVVAAAGPLLIGLGKVSKGLSSTIDLVLKAKNGFDLFSKSSEGLGGVIGKLPGGFGLAVTAVAGLTAAVAAASVAVNNHIDAVGKEMEAVDGEYASYNTLLEKAKEYKESAEENAKSSDEIVASYESQERKVDSLRDRLGMLIEQEELSSAQKAQMRDIVQELNSIYPDLGLTFDENTGKIKSNTGEIINNTEELDKNLQKSREVAKEKAYSEAIEKQTAAIADSQIAYLNASEDIDYYRKKMGETQQSINALTAEGKANTDECRELQDQHAVLRQKWQESKEALEGLNDGLQQSTEKLLLMKNQIETGGLDTIGDGMVESLNEVMAQAEKTGVQVPESIVKGIQDRSMAVHDAAKTLANIDVLNQMVDKAGKIGGQIPIELANAAIAGSGSIDEINEELAAMIDFAETIKKSEQAGKEIPESIAKELADGSIPVKQRMQDLCTMMTQETWKASQDIVKAMQDGDAKATEAMQNSVIDTVTGKKYADTSKAAQDNLDLKTPTESQVKASEETISKSGIPGAMKVTAENALEYYKYNLDQLPGATEQSMQGASNAIAGSDADSVMVQKSSQINNALDLSGAEYEAQRAASKINNGLAGVKTDYQIRFEIMSNGGTSGWGTRQMSHADGGVFLKPTLLPSLAGNPHVVGEAGAEAILPIKDLEPMIQNSLAKVLFEVENAKTRAGSMVKIDYDKLAAALKSSLKELKLNASFAVGSNVITREVIPLVDRGLERIRKKR